jgi:hypothetical protein
MHICKCVQSHNIFNQKNVSLTPVTFIGCLIANTVIIQLIVQKFVTKPVNTAHDFSIPFIMFIKYKIVLSLKYEKLRCVYIVYWMSVVDTNPVIRVV